MSLPNWLEPNPWVDPWMYRQRPNYRIITTTNTAPLSPVTDVSEDETRRIVREEIAELPIRYDVPDAPEANR